MYSLYNGGVAARVCVSCLSLAAFPHYCTDLDVTLEAVPASCAVLGGFAIGARVSLLWQYTRLMRHVREDASTGCMAGYVSVPALNQCRWHRRWSWMFRRVRRRLCLYNRTESENSANHELIYSMSLYQLHAVLYHRSVGGNSSELIANRLAIDRSECQSA